MRCCFGCVPKSAALHERHGISNYRRKTLLALCVRGIHRRPGDSPHKGPSNAESVSMSWPHHGLPNSRLVGEIRCIPPPWCLIGSHRNQTHCLWRLQTSNWDKNAIFAFPFRGISTRKFWCTWFSDIYHSQLSHWCHHWRQSQHHNSYRF